MAWSLPSPCTAFFPFTLGQFTSVTYPRRTGGKRLDKNRMRMSSLLFEIHIFAWPTASGNVCACVKFAGKDFVDGKS